jgi:hypothetical protein
MQSMKLKKLLPKTLVVLLSLVMIGGLLTVTPIKSLWVTDAEARRGTAAGVGGGPVGSGPGYGGARVAATPRSYVYPGPGVPGPRGVADPRGVLDPRGPFDPRNPYR